MSLAAELKYGESCSRSKKKQRFTRDIENLNMGFTMFYLPKMEHVKYIWTYMDFPKRGPAGRALGLSFRLATSLGHHVPQQHVAHAVGQDPTPWSWGCRASICIRPKKGRLKSIDIVQKTLKKNAKNDI